LKLTTASYQRPNGHNIHRFPDAKETDEWGVKPNDGFELKLSLRELERLVQYRRQRDILVAKLKAPQADEVEKKDQTGDEAKPAGDAAKPDAEKEPDAADKPQKPASDKADDADKKDDESDNDAQQESDLGKDPPQAQTKPDAEKPPEFVDRQLRKAIEFLTSELARAE
jgi:carboxyl-terminal processing protease